MSQTRELGSARPRASAAIGHVPPAPLFEWRAPVATHATAFHDANAPGRIG